MADEPHSIDAGDATGRVGTTNLWVAILASGNALGLDAREWSLPITAAERTVMVVDQARPHPLPPHFVAARGKVLVRPNNTGNLAEVLLPTAWVLALDPDGTLAMFPTGHLIAPRTDFLHLLQRTVTFAETHSQDIFVFGAEATDTQTIATWLEPGAPLSAANQTVRRIRKYHVPTGSAPHPDAQCFYRAGFLWDTAVVVARASAIWESSRICFPDVMERFDALRVAMATLEPREVDTAIADTLNELPRYHFADDVLRMLPSRTAVVPMLGLNWIDWAHPQRILESLPHAERKPAHDNELPNDARATTAANELKSVVTKCQ